MIWGSNFPLAFIILYQQTMRPSGIRNQFVYGEDNYEIP
jgi:hypothetical protein